MQIIFQDSTSSLNPRMTVKEIIEEPLIIQKIYKNKEERLDKVYELMNLVGLDKGFKDNHPHECSGDKDSV